MRRVHRFLVLTRAIWFLDTVVNSLLRITTDAVINSRLRYAFVSTGSCFRLDLIIAAPKLGGLGRAGSLECPHFTAVVLSLVNL